MEPITIGLVISGLIGAAFGGGVGYSFGSAEKEARFKALQEQIAGQAKLIAAYETRLDELLRQIEEIRASRGVFRRFMWFVFKSDPQLYQAFSEIEIEEAARAEARNVIMNKMAILRSEFPNHPASQFFE